MEVVETFFALNDPERSEGSFRAKKVETTSNYPKKMHYYVLIPIKKNNIKHFLNGPYIGNFMSLWGGLCFWVCVCVYICRGLGARRAPSPLQIIQIIQIGEIRNILKIKYDKLE